MKGKRNVLYPIGFDAFGLPAENAAIKHGVNPREWTKDNIAYMTKQFASMGASFDWSRVISTIDPEYYKWTQWLFLQFYNKDLAYKDKTIVNWCPSCKTVLANEQVTGAGTCERCDTEVLQKELEQWMFKITDYAERLIDDLDYVDLQESIKIAQKNWIGKSEGAEIEFLIPNSKETIKVFTTRPDTLFGATYFVLAPEHPMVEKLTTDESKEEVEKYIKEAKRKSEKERLHTDKEKTGVFTGGYVFNPVNNEKVPVWVADYVMMGYGTGAIMAVPAHDERDMEFAKKYDLPIIEVIDENSKLINSGKYDRQPSFEARQKITEDLKSKGLADFKINYKLHDWIISRQRYWGVPIPIINCSKCGFQPVREEDLPIELPDLEDYKPSDDGRSPLAKAEEWVKVKCPKCNGEAERETDTMDTFVDSSWYFMRYTDPKNKKEFADKEKMKKWLPVPLYLGGSEHNTMHLLYSRFFTKVIHDLGYIDFTEPYLRRVNRGFILDPTTNQKMSKSRGLAVDPDEEVKKYGADTVRMYLAFMAPYEQGGPWDPLAINGIYRFLNRVWNFIERPKETEEELDSEKLEYVFNYAIKKVGEDIESLSFNTGISELMKLLNEVENYKIDDEKKKIFIQLLHPFAPHISEELWEIIGEKKSITLSQWPRYDNKFLRQRKVNVVVQFDGKVRGTIEVEPDLNQEKLQEIVMADEKFSKYKDKEIKKVIVVPNKIINFVL
jgi:leucyl-tRNA synthetase